MKDCAQLSKISNHSTASENINGWLNLLTSISMLGLIDCSIQESNLHDKKIRFFAKEMRQGNKRTGTFSRDRQQGLSLLAC
eukprot:1161600-Pelagomonas_calceolata.AAC.10